MTYDTLLPFDLPPVRPKKVTANFKGGLTSSNVGLVLLGEAERRFGPGRDAGRLHPELAQTGDGGPRAVGASACSPSKAATRMQSTSTPCARILCSIWPSAGRGRAAARGVRSRRWGTAGERAELLVVAAEGVVALASSVSSTISRVASFTSAARPLADDRRHSIRSDSDSRVQRS